MIYFLIFYVLPAFLMWRYIHVNFSKGGREEGKEILPVLLLFVFLPVINFFGSVFFWLTEYPKKRAGRNIGVDKFFRIKK